MRALLALTIAVALLACSKSDERANALEQERLFWNATYREGRTFTPSPFVMDVVKNVPPGRALDVGMGQGRNALYLASIGWDVTGVDISDEGLRQAREAATARKLSLHAIQADIEAWDHGSEHWDLVLLVYTGDDPDKVRRSLKRGGLVISERFHSDANARIGTTPEALAKAFAHGFKVLRNETRDELNVWGNPDGTSSTVVNFAAQKL